jgi:glyoxylase-like metal-dependent hydrolase (beta-lactamase superfamily II)
LDGTRTYLVGERDVLVIDPGPNVPEHVRALVVAARNAEHVRVLVTHGHPDHAAAARPLAEALGAEVWGPDLPEIVDRVVRDGERITFGAGTLEVIHTPGHTEEHLCFHWLEPRALFAGDHLLGEGDTTWVAEYPGCVADYFDSMERLRKLDLAKIYPAHGPPLDNPAEAIERFEVHRRERVRQVEEALRLLPAAQVNDLLKFVYGDALPSGLAGAAARSLGALVDYVRGVRRR